MTSKEYQSAKFIDLHTHGIELAPSSQHQISIYSYSPEINILPNATQLYSAGVHPWKLNNAESTFNKVKQLCQSTNCLFVGEAGLDRTILQENSLKYQETIFKWHIELANKLSKPLIIHNVRCLSEIFRLHKEYHGHTSWILHDFNGSFKDFQECRKRQIYISLGPRFYESTTAKIAKAIATNKFDLDSIFFETDDRDDINIEDVYIEFAQRQGVSLGPLKEVICKNLQTLLGKNLMN